MVGKSPLVRLGGVGVAKGCGRVVRYSPETLSGILGTASGIESAAHQILGALLVNVSNADHPRLLFK